MTRVSIVILNWNGKAFLERFLPTLLEHSAMDGVEVVVADNGSSDESVAFLKASFPQVSLILLDQNYGFTGGYNRALEQLESEYYLLLNSDVEVTPGWLSPLLHFMEKHPGCAACSPKILDQQKRDHFEHAGAAGGFIDRYGYPFCRGRIFDQVEADQGQYEKATEVFWGSGACLMLRARTYHEAGGLDEQFFAHMEEIDLCWRLKRMGHSIWYIPASTVYHVGGGTLDYTHPRKTYLNYRNNLLLLYKNLPPGRRGRTILLRKLLDGVSALRFLLQGNFSAFRAVARAHRAYSGMKKSYKGTGKEDKLPENDVLVTGMYPRSIVMDFFLKGRKTFGDLNME